MGPLAKIFMSIFLLSTVVHAEQITGKLIIYAPLEVGVQNNMVLPSIFTDSTGVITSEDNSRIISGHNGTNAIVCVSGEPSKQFSLSFVDSVVITNGTTELTVNLSMGSTAGSKTGRILNGGGSDCAGIKGSVTLPGSISPGHYVNQSGSVVVTATYDAM